MRAKIYLITGFLGSGKTTLLNHILTSANALSSTVVVVNEFGTVGIDASLVTKTAAADIVELTSGCICCSIKTDMIQTLQILREEYAPERVVIEATGVADPLAVVEVLEDRLLSSHFCLEKIITVIDADFWDAREAFGTVFDSQLCQADLVLLNKVDTIDRSEIPEMLRQVQDHCKKGAVLPTLHCHIDPELLWAGEGDDNTGTDPATDSGFGFKAYDPETDFYSPLNRHRSPAAEDAGFVTFSFETPGKMDEKKVGHFLETLPLELFRIKGPVRFSTGTKMLNFVGGKSQWIPWPEAAKTCLVFIGWDVVEEPILDCLTRCIDR